MDSNNLPSILLSDYPLVTYRTKTNTETRFDDLRGRSICLAGPPAVGKSEIAKSLVHHLVADGIKAKYFPEKINIQHLKMYLENPKKEAYSFQDGMIERRLSSYYEACTYIDSTGGIAIIDGPPATDNVFELFNYVSGNIDDDHHRLYINKCKEFEQLRRPDYLVYLDASPEINIQRLINRGNGAEINTYNVKFYEDYRKYSMLVIGSQSIATIPYESNISKEDGFLAKEDVYKILDMIKSRSYETLGMPENLVRRVDQKL